MPIHYQNGDALEGERITCQCRKYTGPRLIRGTQSHRSTEFILRDYAYCVIEKPLIRAS